MTIARLIFLSAALGFAQTSHLAFEVASIKLFPKQGITRLSNSAFRIEGTAVEDFGTLRDLIMDAYEFREVQVAGLPDWGTSDSYTITAKMAADQQPLPFRVRPMLQNLLADRFQLKSHMEKRQITVYALVAGKGGPKPPLPPNPDGTRARGLTIDAAMGILQRFADAPILNNTGLDKNFVPQPLNFAAFDTDQKANPGFAGSSIFTDIEEKWGMKLERQKVPMDVMVVDHVERPSAN